MSDDIIKKVRVNRYLFPNVEELFLSRLPINPYEAHYGNANK